MQDHAPFVIIQERLRLLLVYLQALADDLLSVIAALSRDDTGRRRIIDHMVRLAARSYPAPRDAPDHLLIRQFNEDDALGREKSLE